MLNTGYDFFLFIFDLQYVRTFGIIYVYICHIIRLKIALFKRNKNFTPHQFLMWCSIIWPLDGGVSPFGVCVLSGGGGAAAPPSLSESGHREWIHRSPRCNPVSFSLPLPGSLAQSSAMASTESLLSGYSRM